MSQIEKDSPSTEIIRLFEKTRVAYLSARTDPKEYGGRWRSAIDSIREAYDSLNEFGNELHDYIDEPNLEHNDARNPSSKMASTIYEGIKELRYSSELIDDPFARKFKGNVLEALLSSPETMAKFIHYAMRADDKTLPKKLWAIKDMKPDDITDGLTGLDLEDEDIALYIIEHYGDGKDSKPVEKKVKAGMQMLELLYFSSHEEKEWESLKDIEKSEKKADSDFLVPNKPMYRIFDIDDINELKGFSGDWVVQEKYDGMRVQLHKIDGSVKVYSYNEKDITDKCKEQVKELKSKQFGDCILDAELILFDDDEPLHRADTIAHVFKGKYANAKLRCHVFDIMRHDEQNLTDEELSNRITILFNNYSSHSSDALAFPSKKDTRMADSLKDIEDYAKIIMEMPTSEGVVIKDSTSTYYIGTRKNPKWIKWKKFVDLDLIVLDKKKTKSNLYSYTLGAGPTEEEGKHIKSLKVNGKDKFYMDVGNALNTQENVEIGEIIRVKVDEVKSAGDRFTIQSAKVIEVPEVDEPDKLVTLELLAQDTKKSLNYKVEALTKGVAITDHIHGTAILKSLDGFTFYEPNLMSKNAILDIDIWKEEVEMIMKTKQGLLTSAIFNHLKANGPKSPKELHIHLSKKQPSLYEDILDSTYSKLKNWAEERDGISFKEGKLLAEDDKILQEITKAYKTPKEQQSGDFKIYRREDDNLNVVMKLGDESINWFIDIEDSDDIFDLFGKAGKYPAEVASTLDRGKVVDSGKVRLGIQRHGYHEYFLEGNKFETKLHVRVVPVKDKKMRLAWTGFKQSPADLDGDEGIWDITQDKNKDLLIPK